MSLYAAIYAREFPAQALLRLRPHLCPRPCVVLEGDPPQQFVCARNARARRMGLQPGMTRVEVETFPDITILRRSPAEESSARAALLDSAALFSPALEDHSSAIEFVSILDIAGTTRLHGSPSTLVSALRERIHAAGISASIAVASNFHAAICLARGLHATTHPLVIRPLEQAAALAPLALSVLDLMPEQAEIFAAWGIHTLGELAALPETALIARMGQAGRRLRQLALGTHPHHFVPTEPPPDYTEIVELDTPIEQLESLLFLAGAMLDQLILRISGRALAIATITVTLTLEPTGTHTRTVSPALPTNDKHLWLKLIHLDLEAHPPEAPILALALTAEPGRTSKVQMGLFSPQLPDATRLDVALARVRALVGEDAVGTPVLSDTHSADAFRMEPFSVTNTTAKQPYNQVPHPGSALAGLPASGVPLTQRQLRPAEEIFVTSQHHQPATFYFRQKKYSVSRAYGPWLSAGDWWSRTLWGTEQWDIVARSPEGALLCCCITRDLMQNRWHMVALYD